LQEAWIGANESCSCSVVLEEQREIDSDALLQNDEFWIDRSWSKQHKRQNNNNNHHHHQKNQRKEEQEVIAASK
jgi:hypothetical protein